MKKTQTLYMNKHMQSRITFSNCHFFLYSTPLIKITQKISNQNVSWRVTLTTSRHHHMLWPSTPLTPTVISFTRRCVFNHLLLGRSSSWSPGGAFVFSLRFRFRRTATATLRRSIWIWLRVIVFHNHDLP